MSLAQNYLLTHPKFIYHSKKSRLHWKQELGNFSKILRENYGIDPGTVDFSPVFYDKSKAYKFKHKNVTYLLKQYKPYRDYSRFKYEHSIFEYLNQAAYPVPKLIPAMDGSTLVSRDNKFYAVFVYLEGYRPMHSYYFRCSQSDCFLGSVGKSLGQLHAIMGNFESKNSAREREALGMGKHYREINWYYKLLESCRTKMQDFMRSGIYNLDKPRDKLRLEIDLIKSALIYTNELLENTKLAILQIHGDFGLSNILMRGDDPLFVVDFELSHMDWKLIDLAYFLNDFAYNNRHFNHAAECIFLEEYNKVNPITDEEIKYFPYLRLHSVLQRLSAYSHLYYTNGRRREFKISRGQRSIAQMLISNLPELSEIRLTSEEIPQKKISFGWSKNRKVKYPAPIKNPIH